MVSNGEIAAVVIDNEATLKRVYYYPEEQKLILTPENPKYPPLVYIGNQLAEIRILGQTIAFQSDIRLWAGKNQVPVIPYTRARLLSDTDMCRRIFSSAAFSNRETCACEIPISFAISICVLFL